MMNRKKFLLLLSTTILSLVITACSLPELSRSLNNDGNVSEISFIAYPKANSDEDIKAIMLEAMESNKEECYFSVESESVIEANNWLDFFDGLNEIHCKYRKIRDGYNVVLTMKYWDNYAIVHAFRTGNTQALNSRQVEMYDKYCDILNTYTSPSKSPIENELAIHNYLVQNIEYVLTGDDSYNSYNALINGTAICSGYAECFKTFMDMLGIENATLSGDAGDQSHIWNAVKLEDEWYQVDVTWDDPVGSASDNINYEYFNITDSEMAVDHTWEADKFINAKGTKYSFKNVLALENVTSQYALNTFLNSAINDQQTEVQFIATSAVDLRTALEAVNVSLSYSYRIISRAGYSYYIVSFTY